LATYGKANCGLLDEEIGWFLHECAEDPAQGLAATFLRTPEWQAAVPHGLTLFGHEALRQWVHTRYHIEDAWLARAILPRLFTPADELRWLWLARPDLQTLAPRAFEEEADGQRLVQWAQEEGSRLAPLDRSWYRLLAQDVAAGLLHKPGVNVLAHFCHPSGIQEAARATVRALHGSGIRTSCRDIPANLMRDLPNHAEYLGLELFDHTILHVAPEPTVDIFYPHSGLAARPGVYRIVVWFWELETVPPEWVKYAGAIQEIWAPTRFIAGAMRAVMPIPVIEMLPAADVGQVPDLMRSHFGLPDDGFLFLFSFDMSSIMERKNPLGLIRAYQQAFGRDGRAGLVIKVTRGESDPESLRRLTQAAESAGAIVIDRVMSREEAYALTNVCDSYVSLHRSEGFGYTMAEAMLMGKPVIATGYSGNLDFMTPADSLLVSYRKVPIVQRLPVYPIGSMWAEPDLEHAAHLMRWVYEHPAQARALGCRAREQSRRLLSLDGLGRRMGRRLGELRASRRHRPLAA
jgi:glycosyltransferase involved in cell wall biosynthesis